MKSKFALVPWSLAAMLVLPPGASAQSTRPQDLRVGKLLVALRDSPDRNFAKAVVLLVEMNEGGSLGLMINHRTKIPISQALDRLKAASRRVDPIYIGGPVDVSTVLALLRAGKPPAGAPRVLDDVYLIAKRPEFEKSLAAGTGASDFHAYVGYCGWSPGQLESEAKLGAWYIFNGDARLIFDSDPETIWPRLIARVEENVARRAPATRESARAPDGARRGTIADYGAWH